MSNWETVDIALKLINVSGLHPQKFSNARFIFNLMALSTVTFLIVFNMFVNFHMSQLEASAYIYNAWIKFSALLVLKRRPLQKMLDTIKKLKPTDFTLKENTIYRKYKGWLKGYVVYILVCLILVIANTIAFESLTILEPYKPRIVPRSVLYCSEVYILGLAYFSTVGGNVLVCTFVLCVAEQLSSLNVKIRTYDLRQLQNEESRGRFMREFKNDMAYHAFLLKCVKQLNEILSTPLLLQLTGDVYLLCISMYGISSSKSSIINLCRDWVLVVEVIFTFVFLFGYPAQLIMESGEEVGESVYCHCSWYLPNISMFRKDLSLVIVRSQKPLTITAGGFTNVNNRTLIFLLKTAYSFYAYLQTIS